MKWVKVAIGAVIAILSVGIVATSVYGMTQETVKEEVVTFEILDETDVTSGTFNLIDSVSLVDDINIINLKSIKVNDIVFSLGSANITSNEINIFNDESDPILIYNDDTYVDDGFGVTTGDTFELTFEVPQPPQLSGISATLLLLAPLIFAGGVLAYLLNKQNY